MEQLNQVSKQKLLQELKTRINKKEISKEQIFNFLEKPNQVEIITEYEKVDLTKLTKEDWKKACQTLEKSQIYQEEIKLWDSIDDE